MGICYHIRFFIPLQMSHKSCIPSPRSLENKNLTKIDLFQNAKTYKTYIVNNLKIY